MTAVLAANVGRQVAKTRAKARREARRGRVAGRQGDVENGIVRVLKKREGVRHAYVLNEVAEQDAFRSQLTAQGRNTGRRLVSDAFHGPFGGWIARKKAAHALPEGGRGHREKEAALREPPQHFLRTMPGNARGQSALGAQSVEGAVKRRKPFFTERGVMRDACARATTGGRNQEIARPADPERAIRASRATTIRREVRSDR